MFGLGMREGGGGGIYGKEERVFVRDKGGLCFKGVEGGGEWVVHCCYSNYVGGETGADCCSSVSE